VAWSRRRRNHTAAAISWSVRSIASRVIGAVGVFSWLVGGFGVLEMGVATGPEVGVGELGGADPVDVPDTEPLGFLIEQDASGVRVEVLKTTARSVDAVDTDERLGTHAVTIGWPATGWKRRRSYPSSGDRHVRTELPLGA
jgi:hypothetical protein